MLLLIPLLPFIGFLVNASFGRRLTKRVAGAVACGAMILSFVVSVAAMFRLLSFDPESRVMAQTVYEWITSGDLTVPFTLRLDPLSAVMILIVTGIGSLIHVYSTAYMHEERDAEYARYLTAQRLISLSYLPGYSRLVDSFSDHGRQYLVFEYPSGDLLSDRLRRVRGIQLDEEVGADRHDADRSPGVARRRRLEVLEARGVAPDRERGDRRRERDGVRGDVEMLREVGGEQGGRRLDLRRRDAAIEIAIDAQQQIDVVERQPHDRGDRAIGNRDLRVADAERVGGERHAGEREADAHERDGDARHAAPTCCSSVSLRTRRAARSRDTAAARCRC